MFRTSSIARFLCCAALAACTEPSADAPTGPDLAPASATAQARRYLVRDLGTLGGSYSYAFGINSDGAVVGVSATAAGQEHAFLWRQGAMIDLGTLDPSGGSSGAKGVNDAGDVVGASTSADGVTRAFLWRNGIMAELFTPGGVSAANAINDAGTIVGYAGLSPDVRPAFWRNGTPTDLGTLGGPFGEATDVNNLDQVVGGARVSFEEDDTRIHAFLWENGEMTDLGTLGGRGSWAQGINDHGEIVGWSETADGDTHGVLWRKGRMIDLGLLEGRQTHAYAINDNGIKVGFATGGDAGPIVWRHRKARRLPTLGSFGGDATGINEEGRIVGSSLTRNGDQHAVLWRLEREAPRLSP